MAIVRDYRLGGMRAIIYEHSQLRHLCGYLRVEKGHPLHGLNYDDERVPNDVHGGWTFSAATPSFINDDGEGWWFGFDCAHVGDKIPGIASLGNLGDVFRDADFVHENLQMAAEQFLEVPGDIQ